MTAAGQKTALRVLIIEDSEFDSMVLVNTLRQGGYQPSFRRVDTPDDLRRALANENWQVILADYNLPGFTAMDALKIVQETGLEVPFLIISGGIGEDVAVEAMKAGAHDYLMKGHLARLAPAVERELRESAVRLARRQAETALRESEQRYRLLWEHSTDAVVLMSLRGVVEFANPAVLEIFGFQVSELIGKPFTRLLSREAQAGFADWCLRYVQGEDSRPQRHLTETIGKRKDGEEVFLEVGFARVEASGSACLVAFIRDITERKRAEEESRLLQSISLVVHEAKDLNSALSVVLKTVCEATGWTMGEAWLPAADGANLHLAQTWYGGGAGFELFRATSERFQFARGQGLPGRVWLSKQPAWVRDVAEDTNFPRAGLARDAGIHTGVAVPVIAEDEAEAVIVLFLNELRDPDERFIKLLSAVAAQLGGVIQRKRAEQELRENEEQFRVAREIQQRLFPKSAPTVPGFDLAGASHPAEATGGDYFDFLPLLNDRAGIVVGDVTGHGIGPALLMAEARAYLRILARNRELVGEILTRANLALASDVDYERYITMLLIAIDPQTRQLTYANAGHTAGIILDSAGQVRHRLRRTGVPLGLRPQGQYPEAPAVALRSGDVVLLLTDGIEEASAPDGSLFGPDRAVEILRQSRHLSATEMVEALFAAVERFSLGAPQLDDATAVIVKVL